MSPGYGEISTCGARDDESYLATVGRAYAIGYIGYIGRFQISGLLAWLVWALVHITYLIGFRNRVLVMMQWAWLYLTFQRGARLIPPDEQSKQVEAAMMG